MYKVTKIALNNGTEYPSFAAAERALDELYGGALSKLARELCETEGKYTKMLSYLDENTHLLREIVELHDELKRGLNDNDES